MRSITSTPGALRLFAISVLARLPLPTFSIGLLVHTRHLTGSFAAAGLVAGSYGAALGIGGPFLGRLVDRCGQTLVLPVGNTFLYVEPLYVARAGGNVAGGIDHQ